MCRGGECLPTEEDDGCSVAMLDLGAGSIAPLLAAVSLLVLRRRAARARSEW
ncbi:MAG: hypothetical protein JNL21_20195 [Myxococcales bacterium]|nr:hypothetical protein [Myxococcales bacterium]